MTHSRWFLAASAASLTLAQLPAETAGERRVDQTLNKVLKPVAVATDVAVDMAAKTTQYVSERWDDRPVKVREIMDLRLPGTLAKYQFTLDFEPRVGDLARRDYVRYPLILRYAPAERWEISSGLTPYSRNPFRSADVGTGLGFLTQGVRYDLRNHARILGMDTVTVGADVRIPLGNPPVALLDHHAHVQPFVSGARKLASLPDTTLLVQLSYDSAQRWGNEIPPGVPERDILEVMPALLYKPKDVGYFGQLAGRHIRHNQEDRLGSLSRLGVLWDIPQARSHKWGLKGKWQVEVALEYETEEHRDDDFGIATRVRWKFDLKGARQVIRR